MPLDAICLAAVRTELAGRISGQKIDKVQQPERDIIIVTLGGGNSPPCRLLISAGPGDTRIHLTDHRFDNPGSPPMFCMLLRKHLIGARITGITQPPAERVLEIALTGPDAMGVISVKRMIIEMIGRLSNIILVDDSGLIIDCLHRFGGNLTDKRAVLPGLFYRLPPGQEGKTDPLSITDDEWRELFGSASDKTADKWLQSNFSALSPLICREISWRAYGEADPRVDRTGDAGAALSREFFKLMKMACDGKFEPWMLVAADKTPKDFSYTRIQQYEGALEVRREESFSAMLDGFFTASAQAARIRQRAAATSKSVKTARDRLARKLALQQAELEKTADRDKLRECGDIITANLHLMVTGQRTLIAQDFYSEDNCMREIVLDPLLTPQRNAARYYKDYSKAKNAEKFLSEQIRRGASELLYLDSVFAEITYAESELDLADIRGELMQTGYIREQKQTKGKQAESSPMRFESSSGMLIQAGRNNMQNDKLTLKTALRSDIWLHVQKLHGSHVVISCGGALPDEETVYEAAAIAAYYSSSRLGGKVPVDYTMVSHVKKPPGGRPGMVIYTDYKTIIATPDEDLVKRLRK